MKRATIVCLVVVCGTFTATPAEAVDVRGGVGAGATSADITARAGGSPGQSSKASAGPVSGGGGCFSQVVEFGDNNLVVAPCDYHDGMAGPFAPFEPTEAAPTAEQIAIAAQELVRNLAMPVPQPRLSTDLGITGARHSLNLHVTNRSYFPAQQTAFGSLTAVAHGRFVVDWGDGTHATYASPGGNWPNTEISHSWSQAGTYTVTVDAQWSVDWQLAGQSGVVSGLQTTGQIPAFQVIQAQAVLVD